MTQFPLTDNTACCVRLVRDLAFDGARGRVWFARSDGIVGYGETSAMVPGTSQGQITMTVNRFPALQGIALDSQGSAWITEGTADNPQPGGYAGNRTALVTAQPGVVPPLRIDEKANFPTYASDPQQVTVTAAGTPYFVESRTGNIATPAGSAYREYAVRSGTQLFGVAEAPDGSIWTTDFQNRSLDRVDPSTGALTSYSVGAGAPLYIRRAIDGTLWFSNPGANAIVRVDPSQPNPTQTSYPLGGYTPGSLQPDTKGNVWFTASQSGSGFVGRLAGVVGTSTGGTNPPAPVAPGPAGGAPVPAGPAGSPGPVPAGPAPVTTQLVVSGTGVASAPRPSVSVSGETINLNQQCVGPPEDRCAVIYLVASHEYITGFPGGHKASTAKNRRRTVTVARKTITLNGGESRKIRIHLNAKARKRLQAKGRLPVTLVVTQRLASGKTRTITKTKLTFRAKKRT